jgi:hypothetical protein
MTREEHLQWAKDRAIEYVDRGDIVGAFASFTSNCKKHDETRDICDGVGALYLAMEGVRCVSQDDREGMRRLINGFG